MTDPATALSALLADLATLIPRQDQSLIREFIANRDYGLAMEAMVESLSETGQVMDALMLDRITTLASSLGNLGDQFDQDLERIRPGGTQSETWRRPGLL